MKHGMIYGLPEKLPDLYLFDTPPPMFTHTLKPPSRSDHFDGDDYAADKDEVRLNGQLRLIWLLMSGGGWFTVEGIVSHTGYPANSVQAQLRNLRKARYGAYDVQRRRITESGLYEYRVGEKGSGKPIKASCANCARLEHRIMELLNGQETA